jgi:hypothetical protein
MSSTPFLDEIQKATSTSGVYLWEDFMTEEEADEAFATINDESKMPWDLNPRFGGERLLQHAYQFNRTPNEIETYEGLSLIERFCHNISQRFDCQVSDVFCNRFQDRHHRIDWHRDAYGTHIFVLSLGSQRNIQFRRNQSVTTLRPSSGDIYFMPLQINKTHKHRVCRPDAPKQQKDTPRISLVFYAKTPKYATQFKISRLDKVIGVINTFLDA